MKRLTTLKIFLVNNEVEMTRGIIIDFETLSTDVSKGVVLDCSVVWFDWERFTSTNPYTIREYANVVRYKLSVQDQVKNYGYVVDKAVVKFWEEQSPQVRKRILPKSDDLTVKEFTEKFLTSLSKNGKIDYWWSRSNMFDPPVLNRILIDQERLPALREHLKFWSVRDTRTYIDAKLDFPKENAFIPIQDHEKWNKVFQKHDSSWDVIADLLRLQTITRAENDLELL
jgi:hypothetical protein